MDCHCQYLECKFWHSDAPVVMCNTCGAEEAGDLRQWLADTGDLRGHIFFQTSGSSGAAKWVALSKNALLTSARIVNQHLGVEIGSRWGLALPIYHVGGFGILVRVFLSGGICQVFHAHWDPVAFTRFVYIEKCEHISLVPTQLVDLVRTRCIAPHSIKSVVVGGGALSDDLFIQAKALGWPVLRSYGMTESASQIATGDNGDGWMDILGDWEVRVSSEGLLQWRGEAGLTCYIMKTEGGFTRVDALEDGWFTTQDRAELSGRKLRMLGRADTLVKILGELVDVNRVEQRLKAQLGRDCVIFPVPDERRGVKLVPVIEAPQPLPITGFSGLESLEPAVFLEEFPRSALGKVRRASLKEIISE